VERSSGHIFLASTTWSATLSSCCGLSSALSCPGAGTLLALSCLGADAACSPLSLCVHVGEDEGTEKAASIFGGIFSPRAHSSDPCGVGSGQRLRTTLS